MDLPTDITQKLRSLTKEEFIDSFTKGKLPIFTQHLQALKDAACNFNAINSIGETLLHYFAAHKDMHPLITELKDQVDNLDVNRKNREGRTPLHYAVIHGHKEAIHHLVKAGADIQSRDDEGKTPFHLLFIYHQVHCIDLLKEFGASLQVNDFLGCTPIFYAVKSFAFDFQEEREREEYLKQMSGVPINFNVKNNLGQTLLHLAVLEDYSSALEVLALKGAYVDTQDKQGHTPLMLAAQHKHQKAIKILSHLKGRMDLKNLEGYTCLQQASFHQDIPTLQLLLDLGASLESLSSQGHTVLHLCIKQGSLELLNFFIDKQVNLHAVDNDKKNALHYCCEYLQLDLFDRLVPLGLSLEAQDRWGNTPLHYAAIKGSGYLVETLLKLKVKPDLLNHQNLTPKNLASFNEFFEVTSLFSDDMVSQEYYHLHTLTAFCESAPEVDFSLPYLARKLEEGIGKSLEQMPFKDLEDKELSRMQAFFKTLRLPPIAEELLAYYQSHQLLLVSSGWKERYVLVGFFDHYLLISNVRENREGGKTLEIYQFESDKLNIDILKQLLQLREQGYDEAIDFLYSELIALLEAKEGNLPRPLKTPYLLPTVHLEGSGAYGALKAMDYGFSGLLNFRRRKDLTDSLLQHKKEHLARGLLLALEAFENYLSLHMLGYNDAQDEKDRVFLESIWDVKLLSKVWVKLKNLIQAFDNAQDPLDKWMQERFAPCQELWDQLLEKGDQYRLEVFIKGLTYPEEALQLVSLKMLLEYAKQSYPTEATEALLKALDKGSMKVKIFVMEILAFVVKEDVERVVKRLVFWLYQDNALLTQGSMRCLKKIGPVAVNYIIDDLATKSQNQKEVGMACLKAMGISEQAIYEVIQRIKKG